MKEPSITSFDLGTYSVKALQLERAGTGLELLAFAEEVLPFHSRLTHEEAVAEAIKAILAREEFLKLGETICVGLSAHLCSLRLLEVPTQGEKRVGQIVGFELENHIPFEVDQILSDYQLLSEPLGASNVACYYTEEKTIRLYLEKLSELGIDPKYFCPDLSVLPLLAQTSIVPRQNDFYMLCDLGHTKTNLVIMSGTKMLYARTLGVGGFHFTRVIQRVFNLNFEKAESLKQTRGRVAVADVENDQLSRHFLRVARELVMQIRQTLISAQSLHKDLHVASLFCTGGLGKMPGLLDYLSFQLSVHGFEVLPFELLNKSVLPDETSRFGSAMALGWRTLALPKDCRVNFRRGPFVFKQEWQWLTQELKLTSALILCFLFMVLAAYFYSGYRGRQKSQVMLTKIQQSMSTNFSDIKLPKSKKNSTSSDNIKAYLEGLRKKVNETRSSMNTGPLVLAVLDEISRRVPTRADVNFEVRDFSYADGFVKMVASTPDTLYVDRIVAGLEESKMFIKVETSDAQPRPGNRWDFTIKLTLDEPNKDEGS